MLLSENDLSLMIDIIDCIFDINEFTMGIEFYEFERDKMRKLAVERQLEIIGQAANKLTKEAQDNLKDIPWSNIIGLRNKLAHDYGEILAERIWTISKKSLQDLLTKLKNIEEIKEYINKKHNFA